MKNPLASLFKKPAPPKPRPDAMVPIRRPFGMRVKEWRRREDLVGAARGMMASDQFQRMMSVLRNESPHNFSFSGNVDLATRAMYQARIEGWNKAIDMLESLGVPYEEPEHLLETYEPEEFTETKPQ
jgi:hypothetical protein